jgi:hypothetical protein
LTVETKPFFTVILGILTVEDLKIRIHFTQYGESSLCSQNHSGPY